MRFYINTREAAFERPHIHVSKGRGKRKDDLKVWLDDMTVAHNKGFSAGDEREAFDVAYALRLKFIAQYEEIHGKKKSR